jgi:hypothetical protein
MLNSLISSTEQRLNSKIVDNNTITDKKLTEIKEITTTNNSNQSLLHNNLGDFLKKMENSSVKGKISENLLFNVIQSLFPIAELEFVGGTKETGDIMLKRRNKSVILFENKNYDTNVGKAEIEKFYRDIDKQSCNGILISQKTGIVNKDNYEIEIYNKQILLFLHNVGYDSDKIKVAIDIIDNFQEKIDELDNETEQIEISKDTLDEINKEYKEFLINRANHISTIKECSQRLLLQTENFKFTQLDAILNKHYTNSIASKEHVCEICNYIAKNQRALTAHLRGCMKKPA